ncbi:MAG: hypothetical protein Q9219_000490 [cf. Caloplaca sp. 3 TL-2023]
MAVLLTGGTGKTSTRLAKLLRDAQIPFLLASRRAEAAAPPGMPAVKFDFLDSSTYERPFSYSFPNGEKINAIYLVAPEVSDPAPSMNAFIDYAFDTYNVRRFVLLASSAVEKENFSGREVSNLKDKGKIYTACGDGKIPFVSAEDIAAVALRGLVDKKSHNTAYTILGPELLNFDEVATKFSKGLNRHIEHVKLSENDRIQSYQEAGMPEHLAKLLAMLEVQTSEGAAEQMNDDVQKVVGKAPRNLDTWIQENKTVWT